jgi:hypothetical protein
MADHVLGIHSTFFFYYDLFCKLDYNDNKNKITEFIYIVKDYNLLDVYIKQI